MNAHNVKNFSFDTMVGKHARNQFKLWHFSREWRAGIIIVSVFKTATWIISIYAGYYFLYNISLPVIADKTMTIISTMVLLVLIELLTWFFLSKFFKFLYKGIITVAVFSAVIASGIYFLSFHMSTNGLAMRQADKIDNTEVIVKNTGIDFKLVESKFNKRINQYENEINRIQTNPAGWINGKPQRLTADQLKDIKQFNIKIDSLDRQRKYDLIDLQIKQKTELSQNKAETTAEANKYYNYVIAIMIAQFIFNGLLMFSWSRIDDENNSLENITEELTKAENMIRGSFFSNIAKNLFEEAENIQKSIEYKKQIPFEITNNEELAPVAFQNKTDSSNTRSNIGFKTSSNIAKEPETQQISKSNILGKLRTNDMLRYCIRKKDEGQINWTEKQIRAECEVKRWKYFEFKNMMITAGLINEPDKYKKA